MVKQYICDFCGKKGLSAAHMTKHEKHCTMNPGRKCRMCALYDNEQYPLSELLSILPEPDIKRKEDEYGITESCENIEALEGAMKILREKTEGCPMCIFATIRQKGIHPSYLFDYKKECNRFWKDYNEQQLHEDRYGY